MRKSDKKKNMGKANLLAETRYLESKGILNEDRKENYLKMIQNPQVKKAYVAICDMFSKAYVSVSKEGDSENIYVDTDDRDRLVITQNDVLSGKAESKAIEFQISQHADTSNHVKNPKSSMNSNMGSRFSGNMNEHQYLNSWIDSALELEIDPNDMNAKQDYVLNFRIQNDSLGKVDKNSDYYRDLLKKVTELKEKGHQLWPGQLDFMPEVLEEDYEKVESNINTNNLNFTYKHDAAEGPTESEYITGPIKVEFVKGMGSNLIMAEIPLLNFETRKKGGSRLRYMFNNKDKESSLSFNYRGNRWENFFDVIDTQYHSSFEKVKKELDDMAHGDRGWNTNEDVRPLVTEDSGGELDLFNPPNWHSLASSVFDSRIPQFNSQKTNSKAMANDNKVLFLYRVLTEEQLGQSMGYISLDYGHSSYEIWTNNEPFMAKYLKRNGKDPDAYSFINSNGEYSGTEPKN